MSTKPVTALTSEKLHKPQKPSRPRLRIEAKYLESLRTYLRTQGITHNKLLTDVLNWVQLTNATPEPLEGDIETLQVTVQPYLVDRFSNEFLASPDDFARVMGAFLNQWCKRQFYVSEPQFTREIQEAIVFERILENPRRITLLIVHCRTIIRLWLPALLALKNDLLRPEAPAKVETSQSTWKLVVAPPRHHSTNVRRTPTYVHPIFQSNKSVWERKNSHKNNR